MHLIHKYYMLQNCHGASASSNLMEPTSETARSNSIKIYKALFLATFGNPETAWWSSPLTVAK